MKSKFKILIIDDHPIVYEGMKQLIERDPTLTVSCHAKSVDEGLSMLEKSDLDLVIVDLALKGRNGLEFVKTAAVSKPTLPMLVVSFFDEEVYAERTLRAGARGYLMKSEAADRLPEAVNAVLKGKIFLSDNVRQNIIQNYFTPSATADSEISSLSDRELEVFELLGQALSTKEIAGVLQLSAKTIETYRSHIKRKLGIDTATKLIQFASQYFYELSLGKEYSER